MALMVADREEAIDVCEQLLAAAHRNGSMFGITAILLWRSYALLRRGDLPEAEESIRAAVDEHARVRLRPARDGLHRPAPRPRS